MSTAGRKAGDSGKKGRGRERVLTRIPLIVVLRSSSFSPTDTDTPDSDPLRRRFCGRSSRARFRKLFSASVQRSVTDAGEARGQTHTEKTFKDEEAVAGCRADHASLTGGWSPSTAILQASATHRNVSTIWCIARRFSSVGENSISIHTGTACYHISICPIGHWATYSREGVEEYQPKVQQHRCSPRREVQQSQHHLRRLYAALLGACVPSVLVASEEEGTMKANKARVGRDVEEDRVDDEL